MKNILLKTLICTLTIGTLNAHPFLTSLPYKMAAAGTGAAAGYGIVNLANTLATDIGDKVTNGKYDDAAEETFYVATSGLILGTTGFTGKTLTHLYSTAGCKLNPVLAQSLRIGKRSLIAGMVATVANAGYTIATQPGAPTQNLMKSDEKYQQKMYEIGSKILAQRIKAKVSDFYNSCITMLNDTKVDGHILIGPR